MDGETNSPEHNSRPRRKRQVRKQERLCYSAPVQKRFRIHEKWTVTEKARLLEALKRYEPHNITSIAAVVGTKTEDEVDEKIQQLRTIDCYRHSTDRVDGRRGPEEVPIEAWIDLVQEMTTHESADYSQFVPGMLGLIARNEQFADSGYTQLKWKNIYQFLADITEDKVDIHQLSDLEYLIVLDLMRNLGTTLLKSDTSMQRQVLDHKYNLLNYKSHSKTKIMDREIIAHNIAQALSNDFWEPEEMASLLSHGSKSNVASSSQPSSSSVTASMVRTGAASSSPTNANVQVTETGSGRSPPIQGTSMEASTSSTSTSHDNTDQQNNTQGNGPEEVNVAETAASGQANSGVSLLYSSRIGKKFLHPKYFTLNPLCIPTQLLTFRPQTLNK
ncbi:hypothetical protein BsWGS_16724 [Bradybaena similaris]